MTDLTVIRADGTEETIKIHSTAATGMIYQRIFGRNFQKDVDAIQGDDSNGDVAAVQETFPRVFYIWSLLANFGTSLTLAQILGKTEEDYLEWLMNYSLNAFTSPKAVSAFADEYARGLKSNTESKN